MSSFLSKLFSVFKSEVSNYVEEVKEQPAPVEEVEEEFDDEEKAPRGISAEELKQRIENCLDTIEGITYQTDVAACEIDASAHPAAKPITFLVSKAGKAVLAIVIVTNNTYKSMPVKGTQMLVEAKGIEYMRFFPELENEVEYISERIRESL